MRRTFQLLLIGARRGWIGAGAAGAVLATLASLSLLWTPAGAVSGVTPEIVYTSSGPVLVWPNIPMQFAGGIKLPSSPPGSMGCLQVDATGQMSSAGASCGSGGAGSLQVGTAQAGAYTLAYTGSAVCPAASDQNCLIAETGGAAITINQSTSSYFPPGSMVVVGVPAGYPNASVALGAGAAFGSVKGQLNSSGGVIVPSGGNVQLITAANGAYDVNTSYGEVIESPNFLENLNGNVIPNGNLPLSANWPLTHATLSAAPVAGGPLGAYSVLAEDATTNSHLVTAPTFTSANPFARLIIVAAPQGANTRFLNPQINIAGIAGPVSIVLANAAGNCAMTYNRYGGGGTPQWLAGLRSFKFPGWATWCYYEIQVNLGPAWNTGTGNQPVLAISNSSTIDAGSYAGDGSSGFNIAGVFWGTGQSANTNEQATQGPDAATVGNTGEIIQALCPNVAGQTASFTNGSANIGLATTALNVGCPVNFTTSGSLPTNFVVGTNYYVKTQSGLTITVSATIGGAAISAGSAGSGTQTGVGDFLESTTVAANFAGVILTGGNWNCWGNLVRTEASTASVLSQSIGQTSATIKATDPSYVIDQAAFTSGAGQARAFGLTPQTAPFNGSATVYAVLQDTNAGAETVSGNLICQRPR